MINAEHMQERAAGRAKTYAILAAIFTAPPTPELAAAIASGALDLEQGSPLAAAASELTAAFRQLAAAAVPDNDVIAEHTRLFVLPSGVVPHESYYLDDNRRLGGHVTVAVQRYYNAAAATTSDACLELPDHMGVELGFMKFLTDIEAQLWQEEPESEGLAKCLELQQGFLEGHLLRWHEALCRKVVEETNLDLYRALARLTLDFLTVEATLVPALALEVSSQGRTTCVYA